ncbi:MAG: LysR family transcriptional regulator [Pirellulales bacterium]|nr:LysR family transcriptional regulator [Pirellulales bacterium]
MATPVSLYDLNYHHLLYFWTVAHEGTVAAACAKLHLAQPTVSMQIRSLERALGCKLFRRAGRTLALTEVGQMVYRHADEMFAHARELTQAFAGGTPDRAPRLVVGVPDVMPKLVTYRLLAPALQLPQPVQLECREAKFDQLLADLAVHRFDVLLSDAPIGLGVRVKAFEHILGDSAVAFCAARPLARRLRGKFPHSLHQAPLLLPTENTQLRRSIDAWLEARQLVPHILGQFEDSALLKEFGLAGVGAFPVPSVVVDDVRRQYRVEIVGQVPEIRSRFYAITTQRRVQHPAVLALLEAARNGFLGSTANRSHSASGER